MFKKAAQRVDKVDTVVGPGTEFEGSIKATGIVRIDGKLKGSIETTGDIIIGDQGEVTADVDASNITIAGKIRGNISVKDKTTILQKGVVEGDIDTKSIVIEEGATFKGKCVMGEERKHSSNNQNNQNNKGGKSKAS
ncbi:bactofilin family protein [Desulfuribacillus alkaliarsenatis]|uniref:Cell shape determination protein CcmA n=1 Tax=Desulfuribacillus alkaliarsenatis TaxID=766136 RepID=A0A1E5G2P1_9FIRM|nr:polymer-forming cytoskeletal protein [Desulfuribacillus alkaliarsenatis]OEF97328.1 hypothetical protein BHF68_03695 [Desulfuribacillus alkaliarsenatis]